ncbi:MAG TPA: ANTAR domain-containing protein [Pseudonocardiaceae bacterium]|nr:ANTAR domain-containing protein [Pseudonocardiaceae bacterium]
MSVWTSLADLLGRMLHGIRGELPESLGLSVTVRYPRLPATELEVLAANGCGVVLSPAQVHRYGGPVLDAAVLGEPVRTDDLFADPRWPELTRANLLTLAPEYRPDWDRVSGAVALPGRWDSDGVLVLSGVLDGPVNERSLRVLHRQEPAIRAALGMVVSVTDTRKQVEDTLEALRARVTIEQAKGLVIAVRRCSAQEAWATLRRASQEFNVKLRELAVALVEHVGAAPAEHTGPDDPIVPCAAAREAAEVTWRALTLSPPDGPIPEKPQAERAVEPDLPQLGVLRVEPFRDGAGLKLCGEIDSSGHERWTSSLDAAVRQHRDVHLDLSDLQFIDGRGVAILVTAARSLERGRWIVVHRPPPMLRRILDLLWPEGESTIAIKDERHEG